MRKLIFCVGFVILILGGSSFVWAQEEELYLEGVLMDSASPADSIAVVNGQYLKRGDAVGPYQITQVQAKFIRVVHQETGAETVVMIKGQKPSPSPMPLPQAEAVPPKEGNWFQNFQTNASKFFLEWKPAKVINRLWQLKAVLDLSRIYNAAVNYHNKHEAVPWEITQLVRAKYLPDSFNKEVRSRYRFSMNEEGKPLGIYADPADEGSALRHFFVGEDAVVRSEAGKRAGPESEPYDY